MGTYTSTIMKKGLAECNPTSTFGTGSIQRFFRSRMRVGTGCAAGHARSRCPRTNKKKYKRTCIYHLCAVYGFLEVQLPKHRFFRDTLSCTTSTYGIRAEANMNDSKVSFDKPNKNNLSYLALGLKSPSNTRLSFWSMSQVKRSFGLAPQRSHISPTYTIYIETDNERARTHTPLERGGPKCISARFSKYTIQF